MPSLPPFLMPESIDMLDPATQMKVIAGTPQMRVPTDHITRNQKKVQQHGFQAAS